VLYTSVDSEGDESFSLVERVHGEAGRVYGRDEYYLLGTTVTLYDMKEVVTRDNGVVNLIAIVSILAVLVATFRSAALPVILLTTIESAIWLNISLAYVTATPLCYIGYLIISTVQLGATVDYAILYTNNYKELRMTMPKLEAARGALDMSFTSILVSGLILSLAGFTLGLTSSNPIVSDMGVLLGRGGVLSMVLVIVFLPAALVVLDGVVVRTTRGMSSLLKHKSEEPKV
jgi:predicted RND superfamily exporter protein